MQKILLPIFLLLISCSKNIEKEYDQVYSFTGIIIKKFDEKQQMLIYHEMECQ